MLSAKLAHGIMHEGWGLEAAGFHSSRAASQTPQVGDSYHPGLHPDQEGPGGLEGLRKIEGI